jgi:tRNA C32,U32 (ribose-2'-O)-methylase TrmJ
MLKMFNPEAIKAEHAEKVAAKVKEVMNKLDFSKHDKRNDRQYVKHMLTKYYNRNLETSEITTAQWDEMFAIYTPYNGTY